MSRDRRQRAKQRARRRGDGRPSGSLVRTDVPGALDHASGEVDEFDAALIRGAGGVPAEEQEVLRSAATTPERSAGAPAAEPIDVEAEQGAGGLGGGDGGQRGLPGGNGAGAGDGDEGGGGRAALAEREPARPPAPRGSIFERAAAFLRASWAELQRVQWPDRPEVFQATAVVLGFVAVMGLYLGAADWVAQKIINFIL